MKRKLILTAFLTAFLISNASATVEFDGGIQVNDSYIESGEPVQISVNAESNEQIIGVDAKWNSWMEYEEYNSCTGYTTCDASWTFTPYTTGERTIYVRSRSESMSRYHTESTTITVNQETEDERNVDFTTIPSSFTQEQSHSITAEATDTTGNLYSQEFIIEERKDYGGLGWGDWQEVDSTYCWEASGEECEVTGDFNPDSSGTYQLKASVTADDGQTLSARETITVEEASEEFSIDISNIRSTDSDIREEDSTEFKADITPNQDVSYLEVTFTSGSEEIDSIQEYSLNGGDTTTVTIDSDWDSLSQMLSTGQNHDLEVRLNSYQLDSEISQTEEDAFFLAEGDEQFSITDYGPSGDVSSPADLYVELDDNPSTGWCKWEEGNSVSRYSSELMSKPDNSEARWTQSQEFSEGEHTVTFQCFNYVRSITGEEKTTFTVEDEQQIEIRNLESTDTYITEGEETEFEAEIHTNEQFNGLQVDFHVDGEPVDGGENDVNFDSGETRTVSNTFSWDELNDQFDTGNHDLEVRLNNYALNSEVSETEEDAFSLADSDQRPSCQTFSDSDLDVGLENFESVPQEGENYESSARLDNSGGRDVGGNLGIYIKESSELPNCEFYEDHYNDLIGFTGGNVYPDAGESESFDFSYSGTPIDDLEFDETYSLVAIFSHDDTTYIGPVGAIQWQGSDGGGESDPTARFSWDRHPVVEGESVEFDGSSSSDPDDDLNQYRWDFDDGSSYDYGSRTSHRFTSTGNYDVQLRVRDSNGNTDTRTREVEVISDPGDCDISIGSLSFEDSVIERGDSTEASVTVTNNGEDQDFEVKFKIEGNTVRTIDREVSAGSQSTFSNSVSPDVDSIITVEVNTEGSPCGSRTYDRNDELTVVGDEEGQRPQASFSWSPSQPETDDTITFDASGSQDYDGDIVEYEWFFGDGESGYGRTAQHSYSSTGDYDLQLVVEDSSGNTDSRTRTVPVRDDPGDCSLTISRLRFGDPVIDRRQTTTGEISLSNHGESQRVTVRFKVEGQVVDSRERTVDANSQRTFTSSLSPEEDSIITAEVTTEGSPCGSRSYQRNEELVVVGGSQEATLEVNARSDTGRRLSDARVRVQGPQQTTRYTDSTGQAYFELDEGEYEVSVSKSGYQTEVRNIGLDSGEHRTLTLNLDRRDTDRGTLVALVEDVDGERLENAEISVNGYTRDTDSDGRATVDLEPGTYSVTAQKQGYGSWTETVNINRDQDTVKVFRLTEDETQQGLQITDIDSPSSVCRGETMTAEVTIENNAGFHEFVTLTGRGLGSINSLRDFSLEERETVEKTIRFTNVQGSGTEEFTVTANNENSDSNTETVQVESCGTTATGEPTGISMQLSYSKQPNMAVEGDVLKVNGFVDGARGRTTVEIDVSGETKASVQTQPDGYYQTWITATDVGSHTVTATAGEVSASRPLRVIPTSRVTGLEAPVSAFEGQQFHVCASVESQIEPEVILERNGEVVTSRTENGRVCFEQEARDPGIHQYRIAALTSGESNSASTTVETLEMDVEAESFPNQIASVESGSGLIKVDLYNTNENQTRYDLQLEGLPGTWVSQSEKQIILDKVERKTVYFYLTPQEEGSYTPSISVDSRGTEIYREELDVITGGTTNPQHGNNEGFFQGVMNSLQNLFSF